MPHAGGTEAVDTRGDRILGAIGGVCIIFKIHAPQPSCPRQANSCVFLCVLLSPGLVGPANVRVQVTKLVAMMV